MNNKKLLCGLIGAATLSLATSAQAYVGDPYVGAQLGYSKLDYGAGDFPTASITSIDDSGFGARVFLGMQFSDNWASEFGWTYYNKNKVTLTGGATPSIKQFAFDLSLKGIVPFDKGFFLYGRVGPSYVVLNRGGALGGNESDIAFHYGAGVGYDLTPQFSVDLSWIRTDGLSSVGTGDLVSFGLLYYIG